MKGKAAAGPPSRVFVSKDPDIVAEMSRRNLGCRSWTRESPPEMVRHADEVVVLSAADEDSLEESAAVVAWAKKHCPGVVFKVVLAGLNVGVKDPRTWFEVGPGDLAKLIESARAQAARDAPPGLPYKVVDGRLCKMTADHAGRRQAIPLCNFNAWVVEEVVVDDGAERSRRLRLEGRLETGEGLPPVEITPAEFGGGDWPLVHWGVRAIVEPGAGARDRLRACIQTLSGKVASKTVFAHLGWRKVGGEWNFLHAAGAVGPGGTPDVAVDPPDSLEHFVLPAPPTGPERAAAVRASLGIVGGLAPDKVAFPILALLFRAVLGDSAYSGHLSGPSGSGKSELASLAQRHFGAEMDAGRLPGNWNSTANALEATAFAAKDCLVVVDDLAPAGSPSDIARMHREADRLFRAQGNRSGRQRCRTDGSQRPARPPRGTVLSTGEDNPRTHSVRARVLVVEVGPGDVDFGRLTACQADAAAGLYAGAMSAYVYWLAQDFEGRVREFRAEAAGLRDELAGEGRHRRTPTMIGELIAGFGLFLRFAVEAGAIDGAGAASLRGRCRRALLAAGDAQDDLLQ
jgi:hypothetical protein